ncbi:MAG: hypothetical protein GY811_12440 [Myxococcales bacterium]|nr:hypothetical protein [Myxococcales bacterium]
MKHLLAGFMATVVLAIATPSLATPAFAIREGAQCRKCHVNPSGGGMRNRYGRYVYGPTRLAMGYPGKGTHLLDLDIGDTLSFGADARLAYIDQRSAAPDTADVSTFLQMQADLYAAARPYEGLTLYFDRGSYGSFEAFGLYENNLGSPDFAGYAKVGRFMPTFGLRLPDHRLFIREEVGFGPRDKDAGAEAGLFLGPVLLQFGVLNGVASERNFDDNTDKAMTARAELQHSFGPARFTLGASGYRNNAGSRTEVAMTVVDTRTKQLYGSVHWGLGLGRFVYFGEALLGKLTPGSENIEAVKNRNFRSYQELDIRLVRGLDLNLSYEFREPDLETKSGRAHRPGIGVEFYPMPGMELKVLYRHSIGSGVAEESIDGLHELISMVHMFY